MTEIETIAIQEPLCAKTMMLDTVERGDQLREDFAIATYRRVPKVNLTIRSQLDVDFTDVSAGH